MTIHHYTLTWQGIEISIRHDDNYFSFNTGEYRVEHLEIKRKDKGQLPITKTGYKSHFMTHPDVINDYGGVENYVRAWLNEDGQSQSWKKYIEDCKQLTLF